MTEEAEMEAITVRDGDVLVFKTDLVLKPEELDDLKRRVRAHLDDMGLKLVKSIVLTAGLSVTVMRMETSRDELARAA